MEEDMESVRYQRSLHHATRNNDFSTMLNLHVALSTSKRHWREFTEPRTGDTLLHTAVSNGNIQIMRFLCDKWVDGELDLEVSNSSGKKVIHIAAQNCFPVITDYLLNKGANVNSLKGGGGDWTPLMLAATKKGPKALATIKVLINNGANTRLLNKDGWAALHIACRTGDVRIVDELVNHGVELVSHASFNGRLPLHIAALHGHSDVVQRLLEENSCPVDPVDACGFTPVMESVRGGHMRVLRTLQQAHASMLVCDKMGRNCSHLAAETGHTDILQYLVPNIIRNVDSISTQGLTPLHCAIRASQIRSVRLLLDIGANPLCRDSLGRHALDFCHSGNNAEMLDLINSTIKRRGLDSKDF